VRAFAALALLGLALDFAFQGVFSLWLALRGHGTVTAYSAYHSILDLGSEVLLAFSLVSLATVDVRRSLEAANQIMQGERDRLAMLAHTDALTECFNRRALDELMGRVGQRTGLVAVLDLNKLKPINDTLGHAAGDSAIRFTAQALKGLLRTHDHLFRTGGDEFVLVAFNLPPTEAERRFEKLGRTLAGYHREDGNPHPLSISFGLAEFGLARPLESSLAQADAAMYAQKQARGMAR
jgi:diguanylate cyclase (GGDEF)-like protein